MITKNEILGVDIGNVIINHRFSDTSDIILYEKRYSTIPETEGVFVAIKELNDKKFQGNIFLVSKCHEQTEEKILTWLKDNDFYTKTGVKPENVFFCRERSDKDKICKDNNINYFVDDRLEVLSHMTQTVPHLFLYQPNQEEVDEFSESLSQVTRVESWKEVLDIILKNN